jgi:hypothetical protein
MVVTLPGSNDQVSFSAQIKPLFRQKDRQAMQWAFDLWSYEDVKSHATDILQRVEEGSMPCDDSWDQDQVELFQRWVQAGMAE